MTNIVDQKMGKYLEKRKLSVRTVAAFSYILHIARVNLAILSGLNQEKSSKTHSNDFFCLVGI